MKILLTIAYRGGAYCGWQFQPDALSVQEMMNRAVIAVFGKKCPVTGCSRTDRGVHALDFKATITLDTPTTIPIDKIPIAMNLHLPSDIAVKKAEVVSDDFHPRYDVKQKEYRYLIHNSRIRDPFLYGLCWFIPRPLDAGRMQRAASDFVGRHDFSAFMAAGSQVEDTVRTIFSFDVARTGDKIEFSVVGDGFLYRMVRIMVGTLCAVSDGRIPIDGIPAILSGCDRSNAGPTAPPDGLTLYRVSY